MNRTSSMSRLPGVGLGMRAFSSTPLFSKAPRRNRRQLAAAPGVDVVGPPDPVSHLRPIRYGSAFDVDSDTPEPNGDSDKRKTHPYSLSEFSLPMVTPNEGTWSRHPFWSSIVGLLRLGHVPHSWYYRELLQRLEVAEMQDRLRRVHSDAFHQRFWRDNNARYERDLHSFQANPPPPQPQLATQRAPALEATDSTAAAPSPSPELASPDSQAQMGLSDSSSASTKQPPQPLSVFYQAWLDANTERHRAYNQALLHDLVSNLRLAWDYLCLRIWARVVKRCERILGWGP